MPSTAVAGGVMKTQVRLACAFVIVSVGPLAADDSAGPKVLEFGKYAEAKAVAFSPDGKRVAAGGTTGLIRLWDTDSGKEVGSLEDHANKTVAAISFDPTGKELATAGSGGTVVVWDVAAGKARLFLKGDGKPVNALAYSPDGKTLAAGGDGKTVHLWDPATGKETATLVGHRGEVMALAYSPDGRVLASAGEDECVRLWDPQTGQSGQTLRIPHSAWGVAVGPGGKVAGGFGLIEGAGRPRIGFRGWGPANQPAWAPEHGHGSRLQSGRADLGNGERRLNGPPVGR
jgi:WD domain, G-beta repeat